MFMMLEIIVKIITIKNKLKIKEQQ